MDSQNRRQYAFKFKHITFILQIFQCMEKLSDPVHWENWRNNQDWRVCIFVYLFKKKEVNLC